MKSLPPESGTDLPEMPLEPSEYTHEGPTDFHSLMHAPLPTPQTTPKRVIQPTDFRSLVEASHGQVQYTQKRNMNDLIIDALSPLMVFLMVYAVMYFLMDVRYIATAVHDQNLRVVMFLFVMGIVALNRLIARDGSAESILYILGLGGAIGIYTFSAQVYEVGAFTARLVELTPGWATALNLVVVAFLWWLVNRLTHECCVDENTVAGDVGILTGTAMRVKKALQSEPGPKPPREKRRKPDILEPMYVLEAFDPTEGYKKKEAARAKVLSAADRLPRRHPGISIFYFSVPVMLVFVLGQRVLQQGGMNWVMAGNLYIAVYTFAALMLLLLTSLGQLREFFRARKIAIPNGLGWFWLGLGLVMIAIVMTAASRLPMPPLPEVRNYVERHMEDPWVRGGGSFQLIVNPGSAAESIAGSRAFSRAGDVVLGILGLFLLYGALRGLGALAGHMARNRHRFPRWLARCFDLLEWLVDRLTQVPQRSGRRDRVRVQKDIATSRKYSTSLGDPHKSAQMSVNDHVEYAYQALCALAYDLGVPRAQDQTPYEFLRQFPKELQGLREEAEELTRLYVIAAYSPLEMDEKITDRLRKFWHTYNRVRNRVVR